MVDGGVCQQNNPCKTKGKKHPKKWMAFPSAEFASFFCPPPIFNKVLDGWKITFLSFGRVVFSGAQPFIFFGGVVYPIGSMYDIFTYIWLILMVSGKCR